MPRIKDNADEFFADLDKLAPKRKSHFLVIQNVMEYAIFLQRKAGFYVFNDEHLVRTCDKWIRGLLRSGKPLTDRNIELALEAAGQEERTFLRSSTGESRPPVRAGEGPRRAHPGHWADVTTNLRAGYQYRVNGKGGWHIDQRVKRG